MMTGLCWTRPIALYAPNPGMVSPSSTHDSGKPISRSEPNPKAVARKRVAFVALKRELHSCPNVKFGLLYLATLRITLPGGQTHRFKDLTLALYIIEKNIKKGVTPDTI